MDEHQTRNEQTGTGSPVEVHIDEEVQSTPEEKQGRFPQEIWRYRAYLLLFAAGFLGWFLISFAVWTKVMGETNRNTNYPDFAETLFLASFLLGPLNLIILLLLAVIRRTRPIALGFLAAIALNLVISSIRGAWENAFCMVPFMIGN